MNNLNVTWDQVKQGDVLVKPALGKLKQPLEWFYDMHWPTIYVKGVARQSNRVNKFALNASLLDQVVIKRFK